MRNTKLIQKIGLLSIAAVMISCQGSEQSDAPEATSETSSEKIEITIKGSDTVLPLTQKEAEVLMDKNKEAVVTVVGGGSGVGISAIENGLPANCPRIF